MNHLLYHLKKELRSHVFDYLVLMTAGIFFLMIISINRGEHLIEFVALVGFALFYIIWGIYHHIIHDSLHLKTVIEYILIAFTIIFLLKIVILP